MNTPDKPKFTPSASWSHPPSASKLPNAVAVPPVNPLVVIPAGALPP